MIRETYIVSAVRTPIGKFLKALRLVEAPVLGGIAIKEALRRAGVEGEDVEEVIMGCAIQAGLGQNPARQAAYHAGIPQHVNGYTINKVCSSAMKAIANAHAAIQLGDAEIVVAGGMESMSRAPFLVPADVRGGIRYLYHTNFSLTDSMTWDGLMDFRDGRSMGEIAETIAKRKGVTRREADEFSYSSHKRAAMATEKGLFNDEIAPVNLTIEKEKVNLEHDECIRPDTTVEKLSLLPPVFPHGNIITAGNSPQLSDGAAALVLASGDAVRNQGLKPIARILGYTWGSIDLENFPEAPIPVTQKLLDKLGMRISDFDLVEHNEAFAVSSILFARKFEVPSEKLNVHGGAIALGHPLGTSGARIVVTLIPALKKYGFRHGLATICHGGGGATSMGIEVL